MSDTNQVAVSYGEESSYGLPSSLSAVAFKALRITGEDLAADNASVNSNELRSDRQIAFVARTNVGAKGNLNIEMSYGAHDDFLRYFAMASAWSTPYSLSASNISAASGDNSFNSASSGITPVNVGTWIHVTGFATAANNGYFKVVSCTTAKIVVAGGTLVTEAAGAAIVLYQAAFITNGVALTSLAIQKVFTDLSNQIALFRGCCVESMSLSIPANNIVTGSFGIMGKSEATVSSIQGSGVAAAPTNDPLTGVDNVPVIYENMIAYAATKADIQGTNNLRAREQIGTLGPVSIGTGTINMTGTVGAYFNDSTVLNKFYNFTTSALAIRFADAAGNVIVIDFPRIKYTSGKRVAGGINQDVIAEMGFSAFRDPTEQITFRISRFPTPN